MSPEVHGDGTHITHASYYFDNQAELDREIARIGQYAEEARARHPNKITREMLEQRLRTQGNTP